MTKSFYFKITPFSRLFSYSGNPTESFRIAWRNFWRNWFEIRIRSRPPLHKFYVCSTSISAPFFRRVMLITGNSYSTEVSTGNYDPLSGLLLLGDGKGNFQPVDAHTTGFKADGDSKGMAEINLADHSSEILVANNNGKLQSYSFVKGKITAIPVNQNDVYAIVHKKRRRFF
jgi:hypothetical protein